MKNAIVFGMFCGVVAFSGAAQASDGSRQAAGGNLMSSYVSDPQHDPRSVWSQRGGTGQILGQAVLGPDRAAAGALGGSMTGLTTPTARANPNARIDGPLVVSPRWAAGSGPRRTR